KNYTIPVAVLQALFHISKGLCGYFSQYRGSMCRESSGTGGCPPLYLGFGSDEIEYRVERSGADAHMMTGIQKL
ncbi:MAG: hypothetical protein IJX14_10670, partial [Clostridia bacterium]|nr:hypothetical protein [Clostridia bacterium]